MIGRIFAWVICVFIVLAVLMFVAVLVVEAWNEWTYVRKREKKAMKLTVRLGGKVVSETDVEMSDAKLQNVLEIDREAAEEMNKMKPMKTWEE